MSPIQHGNLFNIITLPKRDGATRWMSGQVVGAEISAQVQIDIGSSPVWRTLLDLYSTTSVESDAGTFREAMVLAALIRSPHDLSENPCLRVGRLPINYGKED